MVLIYNNKTNSNNMFHSLFRNLFGTEKYIETWAENFYSAKDMEALELKFEAHVLNGTFQQREKCLFPCDSFTGIVHPAKYPYPNSSVVHSI
jgi:hypothetical protein